MSAASRRRSSALILAAVVAGALGIAPAAPARAGTVIVVTTLADVVTADGGCSLREAISAANTDQIVLIGAGECAPGSAGIDFIAFDEALAGSTLTLASSLPAITTNLIFDGDDRVILDGASLYRPITITGAPAVTLADLTIRHGRASGNGGAVSNSGDLSLDHVNIESSFATGSGGGIASTGPLTIADSRFIANAANGAGGAIATNQPATVLRSTFQGGIASDGGSISASAAMTITDSTFAADTATFDGGSIQATGALTITGSTISNAYAGGLGGAVFAVGALDVDGSSFVSNTAAGPGGALYAGGVSPTVTGSTFTQNATQSSGAALFRTGASLLVVADSTFAVNQAGGNGGGLALEAGASANVGRSTFNANLALTSGGGIHAAGALLISNSTVHGNAADGGTGGGINAPGGNATILNVTIADNTAGDTGGGLSSTATTTMVNTIVQGNTATNGTPEATTTSAGSKNNLVGDPSARFADTILDPEGLVDNGGPTRTVGLTNSATNPAIDAGDPTTCSSTPVSGIDQRGLARPAACDIGAVELERVKPTVTAPKAAFRTGSTAPGSSLPVRLTWSGGDPAGGSGVGYYELQRSTNGGAYAPILGHLASPAGNVALAAGKSYRFRVRTVDRDGNASSWIAGPTVKGSLVQQTSSAIAYRQTWSTAASTGYSGGSVRWSKTAGASASFVFTGRNIAIVSAKATLRGRLKVYINGSYKATVDLGGPTLTRLVAWQMTFSTSARRTIKVVVVGTNGRPRVDLDAFAVLR